MSRMQNKEKIRNLAETVLAIEADAILSLQNKINDNFLSACKYLLDCEGRIIVTGIGKSGHIANKLAATFASTGSPAFFLHPSEASHGDVGAITKKDVVIALSNSGNTAEIIALLPIIKLLEVPLITLTGNPQSTLAKMATINIDVSVEKEACPLGLVPTSSTTATLAMGDALAIALLEARGFTVDDFARSHPGGTLGKRLLLRVDDIMRTGNAIPKVAQNTTLSQALIEMTKKSMGMTTVVNEGDALIGVFTDGDLRRALDKNVNVHTTKIIDVMTTNCKTISPGMLAAEALQIMEQHKIMSLIIVDPHKIPIGAIHMHDLLKSGLA
ncbi:MAG: KpsF/GutQ family sugar-phosphate isomerase [Gammaproteobacteria bacterium]|nr:KpsF/GutQ family sugar-phosphate isomerase [Gammaproteobacteria bacterium]